MKKVVAAYTLLAALLIAISAGFMWVHPTYQDTLFSYSYLDNVALNTQGDPVVEASIEPQTSGKYATLTIKSLEQGPGICTVSVTGTLKGEEGVDPEKSGEGVGVEYRYEVEVLSSGLLMINQQICGGMPALICSLIFLYAVAIGLAIGFARRKRRGLLCTYPTVACLAFCIFAGASALALSYMAYVLLSYQGSLGLTAYVETMSMLSMLFALLSVPFVVLVSAFLALSNLSLIRHEGLRPTNLLGIAVGVFAILCYLGLFLFQRALGSQTGIVATTLNIAAPYLVNLFAVIFLSTAICGVLAAHNKPASNKDFVIILGCGIRADGTPTPLLAGRVQKALDFARAQMEQTGKQPLLVCSGGQGPDEVTSEAASMAGYLQEQGVAPSQILLEEKSTSTWENMTCSRSIIQQNWTAEEAPKVAYSTTNYHVFRSGTFALNAGLDAEGMGAKTKWYFWPNAFLREFVSFVVSSKGAILLTAAVILAFSLGIALAGTLI